MKNKFKLFCTFMICLIFLTLVNTNSPQPSADSTGTGGDVQPQVISIQIVPADNVRLIPPNGDSWMKYLYDNNKSLGKKFTIVFKYKMPTNNANVTKYYFKLTDSKNSIKLEDNYDFDGAQNGFACYTNNDLYTSVGDSQDNGYIYTSRYPVSDLESLKNGESRKLLPNNTSWMKYNLGNTILGCLKGSYKDSNGKDRSFTLSFSNNSTGSNLFSPTSHADCTTQTYDTSSPIIKNNYTDVLKNKYRGYDLMQRCYNLNYTPNSDTYDDIISKNKDAFKTKEYVGDPDRTYSTEETNKPKVLVVDPTDGKHVVKKWFDPKDTAYNNNYKLDIFDPVNFHDLSSNSLPGSPLFNYEDKDEKIKGGVLDIDTINWNDLTSNSTDLSKYKVVILGTWDCNCNRDLSKEGYDKCEQYLAAGGKIILGHDTALADWNSKWTDESQPNIYATYVFWRDSNGVPQLWSNSPKNDGYSSKGIYHPYLALLASNNKLIDQYYQGTFTTYLNGGLQVGGVESDTNHNASNNCIIDETTGNVVTLVASPVDGDLNQYPYYQGADPGLVSYNNVASPRRVFFYLHNRLGNNPNVYNDWKYNGNPSEIGNNFYNISYLPPNRDKYIGICMSYNGATNILSDNVSSVPFTAYNLDRYKQRYNKDYTSKMFGTYYYSGMSSSDFNSGNISDSYSTVRTSSFSNNVQYDYPNKVVFGSRNVAHGDYLHDDNKSAGRETVKTYSTLKVPPCHTVGQRLNGNAKVFLAFCGVPDPGNYTGKFDDSDKLYVVNNEEYYLPISDREKKDKTWNYYTRDNFYLASNNDEKIFMFQTGHSNGFATAQERQIWANLLVSLVSDNVEPSDKKQTVKLIDSNSPKVDSAEMSDSKSTDLTVKTADRETLNSFLPNTRDVSKTDVSLGTPDDYSFSAGLKGYSYFFSDDDFGVGDSDSVSSKEDQAKYTSGDYETYTFDSWENFNSDVNNNSDDYHNAEEAFKNSTTSKLENSTTGSATIDLSKSNGAKYAYICLFDNSTRMAKDKDALSKLGYDGLADGDNLPVLQNTNDNLDTALKNEWSGNSNVNWDSIKKYGNRTVIRVKLGKQVASTKITNSPYFDPSEQNQFFSNKSNRNDKIAKTGNQVITTVSKVSRTANSTAEKMIAISNNSELADSIDDADAWYNVDDDEFGYKSDGIIKSAKVVKTDPTDDYNIYTIEWTVSSSSNLVLGTEQYWYNYVYIKPSKGDSFKNGNVEHFIVDTKAPKISYETVTAGSDYKIKVQDLSNSTSTYQSGIKSVSVTLISDGDREETDCSFTRNGNKRETSVDLELKQDVKAYDKIEITSEDNVGNKSVSVIKLEGLKPPKPEDSSNIAVELKNWYYCSKDNSNKWVSGSKNPSMINTSNDAYIKIKNNNYLTLRNGLYAEEKAMYDATSSGYTPSDDPLSQVSSSKSSVTVNLKTDKGIFTPSVWEQYGKLNFGESSDLTNLKDNSNGYYKLSSEVTVNNKEDSNNKDLDNMNYLNTIPIKGIKSVLNSSLSVQFYASQNIYGEVDAERTYYTYEDKVVKEAWDERDEEGNLIPGGHHDAVTEKVAVPHTKTKTFTYGKALQENSATASLNETLSVDSKKPYLNKEESSKTGRYTNHIVFNDLDDEDNSKGASGIHTIKLYLVDSVGSTDRSVNALDSSTDYSFKTGSGNSAYIDCWNGAKPKDHENNVNVSSCHELEMDIDCFAQDSTPDYLHTKVDPKKNKIYNYLYYEIEDNVGNKATGYYDLKPTTVTAQITEDGQDPNSYPEDNTPDKPKSEIPVNPIGPKNPLFNESVSINAHPTEITDPKDNSKKRKIVDVEVNASITNPTPDFSPKLEIYGYGKNDEYRKPSDFSNLIDKSNKDEMSKFGERPLTKDTYSEIYVDDTYNTPEKPTAHVDIDSSSSLLKFKELEDPKLPYFFEVYTKTCKDEDWIKEVDTVHPLYFASGYDHDRIVIYKVDGDHSEPNDYWKKNPVLSGNYYGTGKYGDEGSVDISNLRTGWYKAELIMYDFNGNPSGKEELWFYQNQPASYTPFNVSISAVKDVDWEGDVRFNYKETKVPSVPVNDLQKDKDTKTNPNDTIDKDVEINLDSNRRPGSFVSDTGDSDYYPLGLNFGANGDSLKRIDWTNSDKTSYNKPKEGDSDKGNPIAKGYAVNWNFSKENKQQLNSLSLNYSYTTTSGDSLTIYSSDGSTKLTDDPSNGLYVDSQELTQTQLDALNSSVDNSDSLNGYLKPPSFDPNKSMYTQIPVKHYLPENFVAKTSSGSVYNGVVIVTVTFKATISQGTMASSTADQSIDLYAIYQGETALDDVTLDRQR